MFQFRVVFFNTIVIASTIREASCVCLCVRFYLLTLLPAHRQGQLELQLLLAARLRSGLLQV